MLTTIPPFSVVIPAHNEEDVLPRCLNLLLADAPVDSLPELIIAANGCTDRTVEIARTLAPFATVLNLPTGSKVNAMNEANKIAKVAPRFFLDADVQCSYIALAATANVLRENGIMAASPALQIDLSRSDCWVRAYYRVWLTQPYVKDRLVGSGLFGLSRDGLERLGVFPPIFGDDIWVYTRFSYEERRTVSRDTNGNRTQFIVSPPRTCFDQIRIEARRRIGNEEVFKSYPTPYTTRINNPSDLWNALKNGASALDLVIYLAMKTAALAKFRWEKLRGKTPVWVRDTGARKAT